MIQDGLAASHLSFKLPFGGFRVLAAYSNSADLLPLCVLHWSLFSNSELSGTVWKQNKAFLRHYWDFPSSQTTYYGYGPWRASQISDFKLMIWVRIKWDKSISPASYPSLQALFLNVRSASVCGVCACVAGLLAPGWSPDFLLPIHGFTPACCALYGVQLFPVDP